MTVSALSRTALPSIQRARQMLRACRTTGEVQKIRAVAQAVATCAQSKQIAIDAEAIVLFAEARIGELTKEIPQAPSPQKGAAGPGRGLKTSSATELVSKTDTLAAEGLTRKKAAEAEKISAINQSGDLERYTEACAASSVHPTKRGALTLAALPPEERESFIAEIAKGETPGEAKRAVVAEKIAKTCALSATSTLRRPVSVQRRSSLISTPGHYNSVRHEFLLVCVRGSCQPDVRKLFDSVVTEERTEHSRKPERFREIIDTIYPHGKRVEPGLGAEWDLSR